MIDAPPAGAGHWRSRSKQADLISFKPRAQQPIEQSVVPHERRWCVPDCRRPCELCCDEHVGGVAVRPRFSLSLQAIDWGVWWWRSARQSPSRVIFPVILYYRQPRPSFRSSSSPSPSSTDRREGRRRGREQSSTNQPSHVAHPCAGRRRQRGGVVHGGGGGPARGDRVERLQNRPGSVRPRSPPLSSPES